MPAALGRLKVVILPRLSLTKPTFLLASMVIWPTISSRSLISKGRSSARGSGGRDHCVAAPVQVEAGEGAPRALRRGSRGEQYGSDCGGDGQALAVTGVERSVEIMRISFREPNCRIGRLAGRRRAPPPLAVGVPGQWAVLVAQTARGHLYTTTFPSPCVHR